VLTFLAERAGLGLREAYGTFNMGAGFALVIEAGAGVAAVATAERCGYGALLAGRVEPGRRRVRVEPLGIAYESGELELR
jgi:phosphoribosylformylglycinamidine cyclo-ligase